VKTEGYVSGVAAGSFVDRRTGARDLGFGLDIVDFLLEPGEDAPGASEHPYAFHDAFHGHIPKRYVELPQICTEAKRLEHEVVRGDGFVAVRQWHRWSIGTAGRAAGSLWEQWLVFPDGQRYFLACDRVTSVNRVGNVFLRLDLPGHIRHSGGDAFSQLYLSYRGVLPSSDFRADFPPDGHSGAFLYRRGRTPMPRHMIRAYQVRQGGAEGPWLAGITLDPSSVYEAWCHQRGYVCMIQEIGGVCVRPGESFGAAYAIGWFDDPAEMDEVAARHAGANRIEVDAHGFRLRG